MAKILTTRGMMEEAELEAVPINTTTPRGVVTGMEWRYEGEVVKRNITFSPTAPPPKGSA